MANLIDIRRRIRSVQNTRQITRAMKFVSAAKLKKAQDRIFAARPYTRRMFQLINHLAAQVEDHSHPLLAERGDENIVLLVITGDKGVELAVRAQGQKIMLDDELRAEITAAITEFKETFKEQLATENA